MGFVVRESETRADPTALIPPDLATCKDCLRELRDPTNRRYRYPFINCVNCGPRYSIMTSLPYDRPNTTMARFSMCETCRAEYDDPIDRRHHAQPIACPACGPQLSFEGADGPQGAIGEEALQEAIKAIRAGKVVALKGLGGFHLICDARNDDAVNLLRQRKHRPAKPFAVMYPGMIDVLRDCHVGNEEKEALGSAAAPIVLLRKKQGALTVSELISPDNPLIGVMLPATPLHHLLLSELECAVVATSGNRAGEPVCVDEEEAIEALHGIADAFLVHDRPISGRCDDSIVRVIAGAPRVLRRARGYAPLPIEVGNKFSTPVLATGGQFKNTIALAKKDRIVLSPHIGDLGTVKARQAQAEIIDRLCGLYNVAPETVVHDLHPDYYTTRMASKSGVEARPVQHHYAHSLACLAENDAPLPCLAVVWDGTGYGVDHTIWGGEFLKLVPGSFERVFSFMPFPLPGGDAAAQDPRRSALGLLSVQDKPDAYGSELGFTDEELRLIRAALDNKLNCPTTSSVGRMFDAVAALTGVCRTNTFEGQAAMALEFIADQDVLDTYDFTIEKDIIDWKLVLLGILDDLQKGLSASAISGKFHGTLVKIIVDAANRSGLETVLLSGGCFQNAVLLEHAINALESAGFNVGTHHKVPPNDGALALGQVLALAGQQERGEQNHVFSGPG